MSQYHTFTAHDAVAYAQQFAGIDNPSELVSAQEVGDGNLNLVFKVFDRRGVSRAIVKQALPYVRCVGESRPLTLDRARLEAQTPGRPLSAQPTAHGKIHHFDPELAVMVMEDLSDHRIWRGELIANVYYPGRPASLATIWRRCCSTPAISTSIPTRKRRRWRSLLTRRCARSPRICSLTTRIRSTSAITTRRS